MSIYERLVKSQKFFSSYLTQEDLSRLGRNYIEVGKLTEEFFPLHDIRLVAVSDGVDSDEGEDDFTPFKNIMNEYYAKDISKKRRIVNKMKGNAGVPLSPPPYGYIKNPDDPRFWVVEPEAAEVVRRIYRMALEGYGLAETAAQLAADGVVNPTYYWRSRGTGRSKEGRERLAQIENWLATLARLGRAFGIHLILATQRPDATIIPGQIRNNMDFRVCGRADSVLSQIILDNTSAAEQIPKDARGRFITGDGTVFQGYLFDEGQL